MNISDNCILAGLVNKTRPRIHLRLFGRINFATMSSRRTTLDDLFRACDRGDLRTVRQAVADGLDVKNARDDRFPYTPLHHACWYVSTLHPLQ